VFFGDEKRNHLFSLGAKVRIDDVKKHLWCIVKNSHKSNLLPPTQFRAKPEECNPSWELLAIVQENKNLWKVGQVYWERQVPLQRQSLEGHIRLVLHSACPYKQNISLKKNHFIQAPINNSFYFILMSFSISTWNYQYLTSYHQK
jgi:hypothetical protein